MKYFLRKLLFILIFSYLSLSRDKHLRDILCDLFMSLSNPAEKFRLDK